MERTLELLIELHRGLSRLGPGDDALTRRALALCDPRPERPRVLDVGAGTGAQSLCLARAGGGRVVAVDLVAEFLSELARRARMQGLADRVAPCIADMARLPFADAGFDIVWSEGAAYLIGFDAALERWRPLLRPRGWLVVTELSWFGSARPHEVVAFWAENYPGLRDVTANLAAAAQRGWRVASHFRLPLSAWQAYYGPLRERLPDFHDRHAGDPEAAALADATACEIDLMARHADAIGYACYVLQRA